MKVYDFCLFNNEFDILDLRLKYMQNFVDRFFVCEINITYQSNPSRFYSKEFIENYPIAKRLMDEDRLVFVSLEVEPTGEYFGVENIHRTLFSNWVKNNVDVEYIGILADCDEIISERFKNHIGEIKDITRLDLKMFYFTAVNYSHKHPWNYLVKSFHSSVLNSLNFHQIRNYPTNNILYDIGWHFSCFGGLAQVVDKIKSYSHTEYNNIQHTSIDILKKRYNSREDYLGRPEFPCIEYSIENYPKKLKKLLKKRKSFLDISN